MDLRMSIEGWAGTGAWRACVESCGGQGGSDTRTTT